MRNTVSAAFSVMLALITFISCGSSDGGTGWTSWRGPGKDSKLTAENFDPSFPEKENAELWRIMVGEGYSSLAVTDKYVYTMGLERQEKKQVEVVYCIDKRTGKAKWTFAFKPQQIYQYAGPRSMPVPEGDRLYIFGADSDVYCLDSRNGKEIWYRNLKKEEAARPNTWGFSGTPVIEGDMLIFNACSAGVALNKNTGETVWKTDGNANGYATPVLFDYNGKRLIAMFGATKFLIVDSADGAVLSSLDWKNTYYINAADPVYLGDGKFFISSSYSKGSALVDYSSGELTVVRETKDIEAHFSSLIEKDGFYYMIDGNTFEPIRCRLICFDPVTGEERWSQNTTNYGSLMLINDTLVFLAENGTLTTIKATPDGYQPLAKKKIFDGRGVAWVAPVAWDGVLYMRSNVGEITAYRIN